MGLGPQEMIIILLVLVLLFGAKKLPELARGSGRALRIFKAETKGMLDDDDDSDDLTDEQRQLKAQRRAEAARVETRGEPDDAYRGEAPADTGEWRSRPDTDR